MMNNPSFLPFDSRPPPPPPPPPPAHLQRPVAPHYVMPSAAYGATPVNTALAPHYQSHPATFAYVPYQSPPPSTPIGSPFKHDFSEPHAGRRPAPLIGDASRGAPYRGPSKSQNEAGLRSPSVRSESQASSARSIISNPTANSKTITYNETVDPSNRIDFGTEIDQLMKVIQDKADEGDESAGQGPTPAHTPIAPGDSGADAHLNGASAHDVSQANSKPKKKWVCDGPKCNKRFVQKTHLDIHRRAHTGQKPYVCTKDNCGLKFSQRGNLKTHMRRHTGEKPYSCSICGKLFAQRGNVRSHEETHKGTKPFICRLDNCNKAFSQLGNMKTHQNNFHKQTLHELTAMFIRVSKMDEVPEEHRELFEYFKTHYKNSNKGIKGRGKARTVAPKCKDGMQSTVAANFAPRPGPSHDGACLPAPSGNMAAVQRHPSAGGYSIFGQQPDHSSAAGMLYEDEHSRQIAFSDRLY